MNKILVAMDSFKGTFTSIELSKLIKHHLSVVCQDLELVAMSDGGEGFVEALTYSLAGQEKNLIAEDAYGQNKASKYVIVDNQIAIMEIALSSGLSSIKEEKPNPYLTSSYGLGETIIDALNQNVKTVMIGLGGSSTNDGGAGMLQALGIRFLNKNHQEIQRMTGLSIGKVKSIDISNLDPRIFETEFIVGCDVKNPLLGTLGASHIYGRQKGATDDMIEVLENNMKHFSDVIVKTFNKDRRNDSGAGAAGGLGFALKTVLNAKLESGFKLVSEMIDLENKIKTSDIVITGEGKFDEQSFHGKVPIEVAKMAKHNQKKVIGIFGQSSIDIPQKLFDDFYCLVPELATEKDAINHPKENMIKLIKRIKI
ncbi:MAG: glycerate kinase [Candidatus Izemoplasmatales bacterium]